MSEAGGPERTEGAGSESGASPDSGLLGLAMLARFHGLAADPDRGFSTLDVIAATTTIALAVLPRLTLG